MIGLCWAIHDIAYLGNDFQLQAGQKVNEFRNF